MGDFSANFHRPESGIHTIEGNVAGARAAKLTRKREAEQRSFEERKLKIKKDVERGKRSIDAKFDNDTSISTAEKLFREKTVGLVTAEEFKRAAREVKLAKKDGALGGNNDDGDGGDGGDGKSEKQRKKEERLKKKKQKKKLREKKMMMSTLSFVEAADDDDDDDDDEPSSPSQTTTTKEVKKDPTVNTDFLPDKERTAKAEAERERLKREWISRQEEMKKETLEITYSYWDGSGHRRFVQVKKGDTIGQFLDLVRRGLSKEFKEMNNLTADALLYVKEDLIIPQDITFYDLIATRARGKSGPLFNFDVHDDIRVGVIDSRVEKDESHPGKVVERRWYDRNKHIFPASRWEIFDPNKKYGSYTIHGGEVHKKGR